MRSNPERLKEFVDGLTINVSEWFRNPEKFAELEQWVLPELLRHFPRLRIWSAGCSIGSEIFSVAILLDRLGMLGCCELVGTDIDSEVLKNASSGVFAPHEQKGLTAELIDRYFVLLDGGYIQLRKDLASRVQFKQHNLLVKPFESGWQLIICRNVAIYFNENTKQRLHDTLYEALELNGILFVGSTERIFNYRELGFVQFRSFFYQKR
ncbi:MAG: protein-glutamate O-methyltransferase CheR [Cyanobacteria bacterium NC_groundwater_1444_Ag_S-0.65um_54_12]|nr:protein-glutamate O-methyltransferase CheR [Cyanobacteria bacterium NC_groundwater_1444_Ag_S-0.65um_54_12]